MLFYKILSQTLHPALPTPRCERKMELFGRKGQKDTKVPGRINIVVGEYWKAIMVLS